jgi:hypothetical protein
MQQRVNRPIIRRFWLLSSLGLAGAMLFLPSIVASSSPRPSSSSLILFVIVVAVVCACAAWFGLRCADAVDLPMPFLRRLDGDSETPRKQGFLVAVVFGVLVALAAIALLRFLNLPNLAGPLWSRLASTFFAAGSLEIVVHLLLMSLVVRLTAGRRWTGIAVATIFFVLFHVSGLAGQSATVFALSIAMNGFFGLGLGVIYARYGFEYVVLCHATGHALSVAFA